MAKNKGVRRYFANEVPNLHFNGSGFKMCEIASAVTGNRTIFTADTGKIFFGIQCIKPFASAVEARTIPTPGAATMIGDDLALNGTYAASTVASGNYVNMVAGDIIYGRYDKVAIWEAGGTDTSYFKLLIGGI